MKWSAAACRNHHWSSSGQVELPRGWLSAPSAAFLPAARQGGIWLADRAAVVMVSSASFSALPSVTDVQFTSAQHLLSTSQSLACCSFWAGHCCIYACSLEGRISSWSYPAMEGRPGFSCRSDQGPAHFQTLCRDAMRPALQTPWDWKSLLKNVDIKFPGTEMRKSPSLIPDTFILNKDSSYWQRSTSWDPVLVGLFWIEHLNKARPCIHCVNELSSGLQG